jgi:hypothetical protein
MPRKTPWLVYGDGSPLEFIDRGSPVTCLVWLRTMTMSSTVVPTSSAVV